MGIPNCYFVSLELKKFRWDPLMASSSAGLIDMTSASFFLPSFLANFACQYATAEC
jgi:hypothetical protein